MDAANTESMQIPANLHPKYEKTLQILTNTSKYHKYHANTRNTRVLALGPQLEFLVTGSFENNTDDIESTHLEFLVFAIFEWYLIVFYCIC